jgi:hypothetical protein
MRGKKKTVGSIPSWVEITPQGNLRLWLFHSSCQHTGIILCNSEDKSHLRKNRKLESTGLLSAQLSSCNSPGWLQMPPSAWVHFVGRNSWVSARLSRMDLSHPDYPMGKPGQLCCDPTVVPKLSGAISLSHPVRYLIGKLISHVLPAPTNTTPLKSMIPTKVKSSWHRGNSSAYS